MYDLLVRPHQLTAAVDTARALPQLQFVLDHAGKPEVTAAPTQQWLVAMRDLAQLANVSVKLSGMTSEASGLDA